MSALRNESNPPYRILLNSYDPLIWRKDVQVIESSNFPQNILLDSGNIEAENSEKIVKSILNNSGMFV